MSNLASIYDLCTPRADVRAGTVESEDFAADLAQVIRGDAPEEYRDAAIFFAHTHPTRGLKNLLASVLGRLSGAPGQVGAVFRLDTQFGGGKTHALIALVHAARGLESVPNAGEFVDAALVPAAGVVTVAAFDGENADPANGRRMEDGVFAHTPWGELAYALAGKAGYERVRKGDEGGVAPGADTIRELLGDRPTLVLIDELAIYLRKLKAKHREAAGEQLTAFMSGLFKAIEGHPRAALVFTLAVGKDLKAGDAYSDENQYIAAKMQELESVAARKATLLNPTEDDETVSILRRRLFERIDDVGAVAVVDAYKTLWDKHKSQLPHEAATPEAVESFRRGYPLHPELIDTLTTKTATLGNFQRVRGMLRLLARAVGRLWQQRPSDTHALHLHHLDPGFEPIRQEIVVRLGEKGYVPALKDDVAAAAGESPALAQRLDAEHYAGQQPVASYLARTVLFHSIAFNDALKGATPDRLRYSILGPGGEISFVDDARIRFQQESAYLDDRPNAPLRFLTEPNLVQLIRRYEAQVDRGDARNVLDSRIRDAFDKGDFELLGFRGTPAEVPDDVGTGKPRLVLIGYDADTVGAGDVALPELVARIFEYKGANNEFRQYRNHLVFLVADASRKDDLKAAVIRRLALTDMLNPGVLDSLPEHQQHKVRELHKQSETLVAVAIQQTYRHVFYPSKSRLEGTTLEVNHTALDLTGTAEKPGDGQRHLARALRDLGKVRFKEDDPDAPAFIRDKTPLRRGSITTATLRDEYRKDPGLPMLLGGDDVFIKGLRAGIRSLHFVYQSGDLLYGPGDPDSAIKVDENSTIYTIEKAKELDLWPRKQADAPSSKPTPPTLPGFVPAAGSTAAEGAGGTYAGQPSAVTTNGGSATAVVPSAPAAFSAEGVLREALTKLWEQARSKKVAALGVIRIKAFEPEGAFQLVGLARLVPNADKRLKWEGGFAPVEGAEFNCVFEGTPEEAGAIKDALAPLFRAAADKELEATFTFTFGEGLALAGEAAEGFADKLAKSSAGLVRVEAEAVARA